MRFASPPDPPHIDVDHGGRSFRVALRRHPSARKLTLRVSTATGEPVMTIPSGVGLTEAERFAASHGGWIAARLARVPSRQGFAPGGRFPLRGIEHAIVHVEGRRAPTLPATGPDGLPALLVHGAAEHVPARIREYLEREARKDIEEAVSRHAAALGRRPSRITIKDTASRWGSCTASRELNFSWRLVMAPPFVLDYLAAHEVGHLAEMNHSHRFWRNVRAICPRTDEAERWLDRHGATLHRYG